jgi:D-methionine transport system ATP-binding protein
MTMTKPIAKEELAGAAAAMPEVVRLCGLHRRFGETVALDGVSLAARRGEILGIIGRSGAGKSTLIRCLNGLERPDSGDVFVEGQEITRLPERALQPVRRRIGMVFQHFNLLSAKTVIDNVALPLKIAGAGAAERRRRAGELLELVGLPEKAGQYPAQLSGGQKQRVGIARALAAEPALLLSDEATSALDPETTRSILGLLKDINQRLGLTILLVTHEMEVVRSIADRVAVLDRGRIVEEGPVSSVFAAPQTETTERLLAGVRPQLPLEIASRLVLDGPGDAILKVDIAGPAARGSLLSDLAHETGAVFRLVHGGVEAVRGEPVGTLFLAFSTDAEGLATIRAFLTARGALAEVMGHVPDHA